MRIKSKEYLENNISHLHSSLNIAVIYGGEADKNGAVINKTHNPRSTKTYEYVADDILQALVACGFKNVIKLPEDMNLSSALLEMIFISAGLTAVARKAIVLSAMLHQRLSFSEFPI